MRGEPLTSADLDWARRHGPAIVRALADDERRQGSTLRAVIALATSLGMLGALAAGLLEPAVFVLLLFVDAFAMLIGDALRWLFAAPAFGRYYAARRDEQRL